MSDVDLDFYFDPICPFAWMTSKWVRKVMAARNYSVSWKFISLRVINGHIDYGTHFPPEYEDSHNVGLRMLRVAAKARAEHGSSAVDALQASFGAHIFEVPPWPDDKERTQTVGSPAHVTQVLQQAGLPAALVSALEDVSWDDEIRAEGAAALALTGKDVGTPILHFDPPHGPALFGPVISRLPADEEAVELWDHVIAIARFGGFAELKRSLREQPQLRVLGVSTDDVGVQEDWHQGSRRLKH
jgi:2-hydroxychromene-2-carboxylate isomerase